MFFATRRRNGKAMNEKTTPEERKEKSMYRMLNVNAFLLLAVGMMCLMNAIDQSKLIKRFKRLETTQSEIEAKLERMADKSAFGFEARAMSLTLVPRRVPPREILQSGKPKVARKTGDTD